MARINYEQITLRQELNKLYVDLMVDLAVNGSSFDQYEEADRYGFLEEVAGELQALDLLDVTEAPSAQQISNKNILKTDIEATILPIVVPTASKPTKLDFDLLSG